MEGDEEDELLNNKMLEIRVTEVKGVKVYHCVCEYKTYRKEQMRDHVKRRHVKEKPQLKCSYCERTFSTAHNLCQHETKHKKRQNAEVGGPHLKKARTMSLSSDADQAARLDQSLSLGDLTICPAPVLDSGEAASVTRDLLSDILEDVIKEEAVPDSEPESTEKLGEEEARLEERPGVWYGDSNTAVAEINSTGPENTLCPAWDHKYAKPSSSEEAVPNQELENDCTSPAITVRSLGPEQRPVSVESDHMSLDITVDQLENPRDDSYNKEEAVPDSEPVSTEKLGEDEARLAEKPGVWDGHFNTAPPAPAPKPLVGLAPVPPVASMIVGMSAQHIRRIIANYS